MAPSNWEMFQHTADAFSDLVPDALPKEGSGQFEIEVDGIVDTFRLKRGKDQVNQNHVHHGEPLVVHVPGIEDTEDGGSWYVLGLPWLIAYALRNPESRQHTVHALDCFMFPSSILTPAEEARPTELRNAIASTIRESRQPRVSRAIRAIRRARVFSVTHFDEAADTAAACLALPVPEGNAA